MKIKIYVIIILVLFVIGVIGIYLGLKLSKLNNDNKLLSNELMTLKSELKSIKGEYNKLKNFIDLKYDQKCTFVRTLRVIDFLDYNIDPTVKYVVFDQFQIFYPLILRIDSEKALKLEKDKYYEITFYGTKPFDPVEASLTKFQIINIINTNKVGLSQTQELCE